MYDTYSIEFATLDLHLLQWHPLLFSKFLVQLYLTVNSCSTWDEDPPNTQASAMTDQSNHLVKKSKLVIPLCSHFCLLYPTLSKNLWIHMNYYN